MRIKQLFILVPLCTILFSCQQKKELDLGPIEIIYCSPSDPAKCLPLEIKHSADGWQAKYVGSKSKEAISLKPRFSQGEFDDSIIVFDEYLNGMINGSYAFENNSPAVNYTDPFHHVVYKSASGGKSFSFFSITIYKDDIFIDNRDIKDSFSKIMNYDEDDPPGRGSERRDVNIAYLLHSNPQTFTYPFKNIDEDFEVITSKDKQLRIYKYYCWDGGNGMSASYNNAMAQYMTQKGIITLDDFEHSIYKRLKDFDGANFPKCTRFRIIQATLKEKTHYLIETAYFDPQPMPFVEGSDDFYKTDDLALFAYHIEKGKFIPSKILGGKSMIELVNTGCDDNDHFKYNDTTKELSIPIVNTKTHALTKKYRTIKIG